MSALEDFFPLVIEVQRQRSSPAQEGVRPEVRRQLKDVDRHVARQASMQELTFHHKLASIVTFNPNHAFPKSQYYLPR